MFFGKRAYFTYTGVLLALGLRARACWEGMASMVCCGGAVAGYSPACAAPVALLLVSQVRKDGLMLFIRVGYAPGGFGARTAPLLRRSRTPRFSARSASLSISLMSPIWRSISRFSHLQYPPSTYLQDEYAGPCTKAAAAKRGRRCTLSSPPPYLGS